MNKILGFCCAGLAAIAMVSAAETAVAGQVEAKVEGGIAWRDASQWGVEGRGWTTGLLRYYDRLPAKAEKTVGNPWIWQFSRESAGMSARFQTDATSIHVRYTLSSPQLDHGWADMPNLSASGVDLYTQIQDEATGTTAWRWVGANKPKTVTGTYCLATGLLPGRRLYVLNLPVYNGVEKLEIGVPDGASFTSVPPRRDPPIIFYGTSIMQGGVASRPGLTIPASIGRRLNRPVLNFGFCGCGRMDPPVVDLLAELEAAVYVIDCEPNMDAASVSQRTEPLVRRLRQAHPTTPILLVENHDHPTPELFPKDTAAIKASQTALRTVYDKLVQAGDKNLHYLPGKALIGTDGEGTGDGVHPNALGMARYCDAYEAALRGILK